MLSKIMRTLILFYQKFISPMLGPGKCKYHPTCSSYSYRAFEKYAFPTALVLSVWRILRCNPFSRGGYDPLR